MIKESDVLFSIYSPARTQSRENKGHFNVTVYVHVIHDVLMSNDDDEKEPIYQSTRML